MEGILTTEKQKTLDTSFKPAANHTPAPPPLLTAQKKLREQDLPKDHMEQSAQGFLISCEPVGGSRIHAQHQVLSALHHSTGSTESKDRGRDTKEPEYNGYSTCVPILQ